MKIIASAIYGFLAAALGLLVGCSSRPTIDSTAVSKPVPVNTVSVVEEEIRRSSAQPASVLPYFEAEVRALVTGYVAELKADMGDYVESGAVLAIIDVPELEKQRLVIQARIQRSLAEEHRAESGVELARANVRSAEARLVQSKAELNRVQASLAAAEAEFQRTRDLVQRQSLESRILDEVRMQRDSQLASRDAVESLITSAEADVVVAQASQMAAEADVQAAKADTQVAERQLDELEVRIDYATLKAPFSGVVSQRAVDPGDLVQAGAAAEPLFVLTQTDRVRIQVPVPEIDAAHVNRGDEVTLTFPTFPAEEKITAQITRLAGSLDHSTRTMLVEVEVANPDRKLLPGMFGQAVITLSSNVAANTLPARAVRFGETGNAFVYVVDDDLTVTVVPVVTGNDDGRTIEILSGVEAGQRVVDAHLQRFDNGQQVKILAN